VTKNQWHSVEEILPPILAAPAAERRPLLRQLCGDRQDLYREVEALVAVAEEAGDFMEDSLIALAASEQDPAQQSTAPMRQVGGYWLLRRLGRGGMGTVYLGERVDRAYRGYVAIKLLRNRWTSADSERRFQRERQILADLRHPGIARLLDGGSDVDGRPYLVMEYIEGEPIDCYCDRLGLSIDQRIDLFRRVCEAVHAAHQSLVVHRDLKPANILVTAAGDPKLLDFGIAKLLWPHVDTLGATATTTGLAPLTLEYASPEQHARQPITTASDVYSLGVLLYELLTGKRPFELGDRAVEGFLRRVRDRPPRPPSAWVKRSLGSRARRLAGDLDRIVLKALHKEPQRRYPSVQQLSLDLRRYQAGLPVCARPDTLAYRLQMFLLRHKTAVLYTFVALLLTGMLATHLTARLSSERERAYVAAARVESMTQFFISAEDQAKKQAQDLQQAENAARNNRRRIRRLEQELVAARREGVETLVAAVNSLRVEPSEEADEPASSLVNEQYAERIERLESRITELQQELNNRPGAGPAFHERLYQDPPERDLEEGDAVAKVKSSSDRAAITSGNRTQPEVIASTDKLGDRVVVALDGNLFGDAMIRDIVLRALPWAEISEVIFPGESVPVRVVRGDGSLVESDARSIAHDPQRSRFLLGSRRLEFLNLNVVVDLANRTGRSFWDQELAEQVSSLVFTACGRAGFRLLNDSPIERWQSKNTDPVIRIEGVVNGLEAQDREGGEEEIPRQIADAAAGQGGSW